jgi:hypothetical protein
MNKLKVIGQNNENRQSKGDDEIIDEEKYSSD